MPRLLYLYPEEWTGKRARELHALKTCLAMAEAGIEIHLVTAGNFNLSELQTIAASPSKGRFSVTNLSRKLGPIKSAAVFGYRFKDWLKRQAKFDFGFAIHLKAARIFRAAEIPYWWEAHEIFAETPQKNAMKAHQIYDLEREVLTEAFGRIATSNALAQALIDRYNLPASKNFEIVPHGADVPQVDSFFDLNGPFVYAGSIADWKGLQLALPAIIQNKMSLRLIGGTESEWRKLKEHLQLLEIEKLIEWHPRVEPNELPHFLKGCRAGLTPTLPESASGRYSLPMKVFDYASCGIPVISSTLPSLASMDLGSWCRFVPTSTTEDWAQSLQQSFAPQDSEAALQWAAQHTWGQRGEKLRQILFP